MVNYDMLMILRKGIEFLLINVDKMALCASLYRLRAYSAIPCSGLYFKLRHLVSTGVSPSSVALGPGNGKQEAILTVFWGQY